MIDILDVKLARLGKMSALNRELNEVLSAYKQEHLHDKLIDLLDRYERGEIVEVLRCENCRYAEAFEDTDTTILCKRYIARKVKKGYCDKGKMRGAE